MGRLMQIVSQMTDVSSLMPTVTREYASAGQNTLRKMANVVNNHCNLIQ